MLSELVGGILPRFDLPPWSVIDSVSPVLPHSVICVIAAMHKLGTKNSNGTTASWP
jgi:hypothetical protein